MSQPHRAGAMHRSAERADCTTAAEQGDPLMASLTLPALSRAIEGRDAATLASFYADNAVLQIVDQQNPPSKPREIKGRDAITAYFNDICGRAMTHRVEDGVAEGNRLAFTQYCTYPDGNRVLCSATVELADGKIRRQLAVQAWDS
jgi:hypothetical protein